MDDLLALIFCAIAIALALTKVLQRRTYIRLHSHWIHKTYTLTPTMILIQREYNFCEVPEMNPYSDLPFA